LIKQLPDKHRQAVD